ncbi:MAG: diiron oxygenase [Elusimicrobia bacterium]|nr:diiron oxygenase [Elusimicrobiota bacterium]
MTTLPPPDAGKTAAKETAVDWTIAIDDSAYHLAPEYLNLYGTPAWEAMSEPARRAYSRHEAAAFYRTVIWFENILIHGVMKYLYAEPAGAATAKFLFLEASEECRHTAMFGEFIRRSGTPPYLPSPRVLRLGKVLKRLGIRVVYFMAILCGEEVVDACNRATSRFEGSHPVSKQMARLHMIDEAAHIAFAKDRIRELWARQDAKRRWCARWNMPIVVYAIVEGLVNEGVYRELGIAGGYRGAWDNVKRRERVIRDLAPYLQFLASLGVITPAYARVYRWLGLMR